MERYGPGCLSPEHLLLPPNWCYVLNTFVFLSLYRFPSLFKWLQTLGSEWVKDLLQSNFWNLKIWVSPWLRKYLDDNVTYFSPNYDLPDIFHVHNSLPSIANLRTRKTSESCILLTLHLWSKFKQDLEGDAKNLNGSSFFDII